MHGLVKVLDFLSQPMQIEIIADVVLVNFNEEFVTLKVTEPRNPPSARFTVIIVVQILYTCNPKVKAFDELSD